MKNISAMLFLAVFIASCVSAPSPLSETRVGTVGADIKAQADAYYHFMSGELLEQAKVIGDIPQIASPARPIGAEAEVQAKPSDKAS